MAENTQKYDFIILGMGAAGLSLAWQMLSSARLKDSSILLIDKKPKTVNDRTWSFWSEEPGPFAEIIFKSWDRLEFAQENFHSIFKLKKYRYHTIRAIDLYKKIVPELEQRPNVRIVYDDVQSVNENGDNASVITKNGRYTGTNIFNSLPQRVIKLPDRHYLKQHFKGWFIRTRYNAFDNDTVRFMDFRTPQEREVRFFYVLPFSRTEALVEYTLFSAEHLRDDLYDEAISAYIREGLGIQNDEYEVYEQEFGSIPMTDAPAPTSTEHHHYMGTAAGCTKPSTGYTFANIQRHVLAIIHALENDLPIPASVREKRFEFYDSVMLELMTKKGGSIATIFAKLFKNCNPELVMKFLDEQTTPTEDLAILSSVPPIPFIKAAIRDRLRRIL